MDLDWPALARPRQTLVVYMGLLGLPALCDNLVAHGLPSTTPAAVIQQGTTHDQRVVTGTLADAVRSRWHRAHAARRRRSSSSARSCGCATGSPGSRPRAPPRDRR